MEVYRYYLFKIMCAIARALSDVQKPVVSLDCGYFDFSLIPFGRSASLKVCLSNESNSTPHYCFKQLVQERPEGFMVRMYIRMYVLCKCTYVCGAYM